MTPSIPGELNGMLSPYLRRRRMQMVAPFFTPGQRILDVGCGLFCWDGLLPEDCHYVGVDHSEDIVAENRKRSAHTFLCLDIVNGDWSSCGKDFDLVLMLAVIEHVNEPVVLLKALGSQMAAGGQVIMTTPYPSGERLMRVGASLRLLSNDKHEHGELLNRRSIDALAQACGAELVRYRRFLFGLNQLAVIRYSRDSVKALK